MPQTRSTHSCDDERLFDPAVVERASLDAEFHRCSFGAVSASDTFSVAGLFAGIGGIELGLDRHGGRAELLCEWWEPAHRVLGERFPDVERVEDVRDLRRLPKVDL